MLLCPAPATTMSKRSSLDACWPMENGVTASGASAAVFTNPRRLILLMRAPPPEESLTLSSSQLPRCSSQNLSALRSPRFCPALRSPTRRDASSLRSDTSRESACDAVPSPARDASRQPVLARIHLRDNCRASCVDSCAPDQVDSSRCARESCHPSDSVRSAAENSNSLLKLDP